jgi:RsiW-degrading membrane proteinase PrsW (M82 family)
MAGLGGSVAAADVSGRGASGVAAISDEARGSKIGGAGCRSGARHSRLYRMAPPDQWYYLEGSQTRGPVAASQIVQMIRAGTLPAATQVAQAGWPQWSPASAALASLLAPAPSPAPQPVPVDTPVYAIKVHCISGPDAGKAYMIGASEVSLGRVSGIGQNDPGVAENHVAMSWQNNVLRFRTFGSKLIVGGAPVTQGSLSNGQQFQMGASTWQVGAAPVELTSLLGSLASRLNKLTSTEKLEGFSLTQMFSEVFKGRKPGEIEDYFVVGTSKTTPPIDEVQTGWPKPFFFMRVLIFILGVYWLMSKALDIFGNPNNIPGLMILGSLAVPLSTAMLLWELNTPRNISFIQVLMLICLGGVISLIFADIGYEVSHLGWLGAPSAGIVEEIAKLLAVVAVMRSVRYKYTLNGIVFGAAIGAGFAIFESAGYAFLKGYLNGYTLNALDHLDMLAKAREIVLRTHSDAVIQEVIATLDGNFTHSKMFEIISLRAWLAPFGHVVWTAIAAGALWRVKGANPFRIKMLFDPTFVRTFLVPVVLHMLWDADVFARQGFLVEMMFLLALGAIGWYVAFLLVQQGLRQIKQEQLTHTRTEMDRTQQILTTSGRFRAQSLAQP